MKTLGDSAPAMLALPQALTIATAEGFRQQLRSALAQNRPVTLDAAAVENITTPCIQLLLSLANGMNKEGGTSIRLANASAAVREAFTTLGLKETLARIEEAA